MHILTVNIVSNWIYLKQVSCIDGNRFLIILSTEILFNTMVWKSIAIMILSWVDLAGKTGKLVYWWNMEIGGGEIHECIFKVYGVSRQLIFIWWWLIRWWMNSQAIGLLNNYRNFVPLIFFKQIKLYVNHLFPEKLLRPVLALMLP